MIEDLYASLVYVTQYSIGFDVSNKCSEESLLRYLKSTFKVDNETEQQDLDFAQEMRDSEMYLSVEILEAKELVPKTANGKSNPFCVLYLNSAQTKGYKTSVKQSTLNPIWKEHFQIPLRNPEVDVLNLEVWDFGSAEKVAKAMSQVKNVKGVRGPDKLEDEICLTTTAGSRVDTLIGKCQITLKDIPKAGRTMWLSLEKIVKSKPRGVVRLKLDLCDEHQTQVAFQEHRHLLRIFLLHEIETQKIEKYCWCGRWSAPAKVILSHHSAQRWLLAKNVALAQWVEYIGVHRTHPLSFTLLNKLLIKLLGSMNNTLLPDDEVTLFWDGAKELLHSCLECVRYIRKFTVGSSNTTNTITQLESILGIISSLHLLKKPDDLDLLPANMYGWLPEPERRRTDILQTLQEVVIQSGEDQFNYVLKHNVPEGSTLEHTLMCYPKVIQLLKADVQLNLEFYDKVFMEQTNLPCTRTLYIYYGERLSDMCMTIVEDVCERLKRIAVEKRDGTSEELSLGPTLFKLYSNLQNYAIFGQTLCAEGLEYMKIQSYHEWFRMGVARWLDVAVFKALREIERAVELDTLQPVDPNAQYSSSAVDTLAILQPIKVFWTQLAWPDVEGSYAFIAKIINDICRCSVEYADMITRKVEATTQQTNDIENNDSFCEKKFEISTAWCLATNNIDYIRKSIGSSAEDLGLQRIVESLAANKTQQEAERCRLTLQLIIDNATDTVNDKIIELFKVVASKMTPAMSRYLSEGAEFIDTRSNAMDRLFHYLDSNITTLHNNLNKSNFKKVLLVIWEIMLRMLYDLIDTSFEKKRPPSFYVNLHFTFKTLIRFFNLEADETSNIHIFEKIEQLLKLHSLETAALIHRYNLERLQEQMAIEDPEHGQLTVKAHFVDNLLKIQIMNTRNLRTMDINCRCDLQVKIRLLPQEKFVRVRQPQTQVHKADIFLLFDESFFIHLSTEMRETKDAMVAFAVKVKDFLRTRFMAEAFLAFSDIATTGADRDFDSLEQIHLKLSRPTGTNSDVVQALQRRKGDDCAVDFMSKLNAKIITSTRD